MRAYRCFFLSKAGQIKKAEIVESDNDEGALVEAVALIDRQSAYSAIEVWEGARKVFPQPRGRPDVEQLKRALRGLGVLVVEEQPFVH